jgi:hypothetical protein
VNHTPRLLPSLSLPSQVLRGSFSFGSCPFVVVRSSMLVMSYPSQYFNGREMISYPVTPTAKWQVCFINWWKGSFQYLSASQEEHVRPLFFILHIYLLNTDPTITCAASLS